MKTLNFENFIAWSKTRNLNYKLFKYLGRNRDKIYKGKVILLGMDLGSKIAESLAQEQSRDMVVGMQKALGLSLELRSMLYLGYDAGYFSEERFEELVDLCFAVSDVLDTFIKKVAPVEKAVPKVKHTKSKTTKKISPPKVEKPTESVSEFTEESSEEEEPEP